MFDVFSLYPFMLQEKPEEANEEANASRYEVYVNRDFVGIQNLYGAKESVEDLDSFLQEQGLSDFQREIDTDKVYVTADNRENEIKEALHVHLQSR